MYNSSQPRERFGGANIVFLFLGVLFITGIFFYFFNGITGFTVLDDIGLDINKYVNLNSTVFLTVDLDEYSRPVSDFGFEIVNDKYYIDYLDVNLDDFGVNLDKGDYNVFLSLIDNGKLIAIKSQEMNIENEKSSDGKFVLIMEAIILCLMLKSLKNLWWKLLKFLK